MEIVKYWEILSHNLIDTQKSKLMSQDLLRFVG